MSGGWVAKPGEVKAKWWLVDVTDKVVGRVASDIAMILMGKHRPTYTPHVDTGDFVVIVNASKVLLTGNSKSMELIYRHSGFPGGLHSITRGKFLEKQPVRAVTRVVRGMLPHNKLGDAMIKKLKVYAGPDHKQEAQNPEELKF